MGHYRSRLHFPQAGCRDDEDEARPFLGLSVLLTPWVSHAQAADLVVDGELVVTADDGFQAIFALPELDAASPDRRVLLADARGGQALSDNEGPLRIVAPADKYPARWVRNVVRLTVVQVSASSQR